MGVGEGGQDPRALAARVNEVGSQLQIVLAIFIAIFFPAGIGTWPGTLHPWRKAMGVGEGGRDPRALAARVNEVGSQLQIVLAIFIAIFFVIVLLILIVLFFPAGFGSWLGSREGHG